MTIFELLEREDFDPETIEMLVQCFKAVLADLHLRIQTPSITLLVARRTIEIAKTGERDPVRLRQLVLESLQGRADQNGWHGRRAEATTNPDVAAGLLNKAADLTTKTPDASPQAPDIESPER
jgi:hypothetical protein